MDIEKVVHAFLQQQKLENKKAILSVSGGVDSVVLFYILNKIFDQKNLAIFHLDHGNRTNTKKEFQFVHDLCQKHGNQFFGYQLEEIPKKDKENFWRKSRKELAEEAKNEFGAQTILTAHHATDLVETMLFRLVKGCGIDGLSPFDTNTKPLWQVPKSEIECYAQENKIKWMEDESNEDIDFHRNLIRKNILPHLRKITPNLEQVFVRESEIFGEIGDFLAQSVEIILEPALKNQKIPLNEFLELPPILQKEFLRKIAQTSPSASEIDDCLRWLHGKPAGKSKKEIGGTNLTIIQGKIVIEN